MTIRTKNAAGRIGPKEDNTFGLHAMLAYSVSVLLVLLLGSILQFYNLNLGFIVTEIAFIAIPAAIVLRLHREPADRNRFSIPNARQFSLTALIGCCAAAIAAYQAIASRKALLGVDPSDATTVEIISPFWLLLVIVAPLCEELLFRPVIQSGLARQWGNRAAAILTAVLFGLFHLRLDRFPETFVIGLFTGIVFLKTKRFWCAVAVHFLCNSLWPLLSGNAPHLTILLNPVTSITLAYVAFTGCHFLGEPSPVPLRGLWQRLNWAAFGTAESLRTIQKRPRKLALQTGTIVVCLIALNGFGHALIVREMRRQEEPKFRSNYVVSEEDDWSVVSSEEVRVRSTLVIRKFPETYEDLIVQLPFQEATMQKVRLGNNDPPFSRPEHNEYHVDLSSHQDTAQSATITILWTFSPAACLTRSEMGRYSIPLKSLVPSDSFSLTVTTEGSGFRIFPADREVRNLRVYDSLRVYNSGIPGKPKMHYGNWGGLIKKEHKDTGGAQ